MTDDERGLALERLVRDVLGEARPENGAPVDLRGRVLAIADRPAPSPFRRLALRLGWAAGGGVAAGGLAVLAVWFLMTRSGTPIDVSNGTGASPPPTVFDPTRTGVGILEPVTSTLQYAALIVSVAGIGVAAGLALRYRSRRRLRHLLGAAVALAVVGGAVSLARHPGFEWRGGAYAGLMGVQVQAEPAPGSGGVTTFYETAEPHGLYGVLVTLTNPGPLPIRLEGLVQPSPISEMSPQWSSVWLASDPNSIAGSLDHARPFTPTEVAPDGTLDVYLFGRAGACAFGPTFSLTASDVAGYIGGDRIIDLAYTVLGLEHDELFTLPFAIAEPVRSNCSG